MRATLVVLVALVSPVAAECPEEPEAPPPAHDQLTLSKAKFGELPGWADDKHAEAVPSFLASCKRLGELHDDDPVGTDGHGGKAKQWRQPVYGRAAVARFLELVGETKPAGSRG